MAPPKKRAADARDDRRPPPRAPWSRSSAGPRPRTTMRCGPARPGIVRLLDGDVGRVADRAVRAQRGQESGDALGIGGVRRRVDAAVHERQAVVLHLSPLPGHAFPEAPVVIVVAGAAVERRSSRRPTASAPPSAPDITGTM